MNTRIVLFLMTILVAAVCASCATRQTEPTAPTEPEAPVAPVEPEAPAVPEAPVEQEPADETFELVRTETIVDGNLRVIYGVPTGWSVDTSRAGDGQILMRPPDRSALLSLQVVPRTNGLGVREALRLVIAHWLALSQQDPSITIQVPQLHPENGIDIGLLICSRGTPEGPISIMHLFLTSNDPGYLMVGLGSWAVENQERYSGLLIHITESAIIVRDTVPDTI
ncbi:MAG: hypothetical protein U9Q03_03440 [Patescibacteria group bacterium]|nr:hypothetical protein [Patescibacteria group bacterium]